jgi:hypothetical protein
MNTENNKVVFLHTPKTGGGAMEYFFHEESKKIRRNYFFNFNGIDDSHFIKDELSTKHPLGNKCVIETIENNKSIIERYKDSIHFKQSKFLMGHTTYNFGSYFPEYNFKYITVLREPIIRTLSNILQFSQETRNDRVKFGGYYTTHKKATEGYWEFIYELLSNEYPIKGLMVHENHFLSDCQTKILQGAKYTNNQEKPNLNLALNNSELIYYSFFDDFNNGLQKSFDKVNIPFDMSKNITVNNQNNKKNKLGEFYNTPKKVIDWVIDNNKNDIELYKTLKDKYE